MSRKTVNQIIGLASIDPEFRKALQQNVLLALKEEGFELMLEEQEIFIELASLPFSEFCQHLLERLDLDR